MHAYRTLIYKLCDLASMCVHTERAYETGLLKTVCHYPIEW